MRETPGPPSSGSEEERDQVHDMIQQGHDLITPLKVQLLSRPDEAGGPRQFRLEEDAQSLVDDMQDDCQQGEGSTCIGSRSPVAPHKPNATPSSSTKAAPPHSFRDMMTNPHRDTSSSPESDTDLDGEPTCGQDSLQAVSSAKRKTPPHGNSEGPPVKKLKAVCKRCANKHGRECVL